jgi:hypothetical protein
MMHSSCDSVKPTNNGVSVLLPDGSTMRATHTAELPIQELPHAARQAHLFPALSSGALLSIGQLCDHGCQAIFNASTVKIVKKSKTILKGHHSPTSRMWVIQIPTNSTNTHRLLSSLVTPLPQQAVACNATKHKTKADLVTFLHATCSSPATSTFLQVIKAGYFTTWPGLTPELVSKYLPKSVASIKGHLDQQHKNVRSTKPKPSSEPSFERLDRRTNTVFAHIFEPTGQIYTDLPGGFPIKSNRGSQYIFVLYDFDINAILVEPMKNCTDREWYEPLSTFTRTFVIVVYVPNCKNWTTKPLPRYNTPCARKTLTTNSSLPMSTVATLTRSHSNLQESFYCWSLQP